MENDMEFAGNFVTIMENAYFARTLKITAMSSDTNGFFSSSIGHLGRQNGC